MKSLFFAFLLACCSLAASQPLEVVKLTGSTFEHKTQATTGQTTGSWCVLFVNSSSSSPLQIAAEDAWEQLAAEVDKTSIMAKLDVASASGIASRFNLSSSPSAILLRDRGMYRIKLAGQSADADKLAAVVQAFVDGGYEAQEKQEVPPEPTLLSIAMDAAQKLRVEANWMLAAGIIAMSVGGLLFLGFMAVGIWFSLPERPAKQPAKQPAAGEDKETAAPVAAAAAAAAADGDEDEDEAAVAKDSKPTATRRRRA